MQETWFHPWFGNIPWRIPWTGEPGGYSSWGQKELDMTEWRTFTFYWVEVAPHSPKQCYLSIQLKYHHVESKKVCLQERNLSLLSNYLHNPLPYLQKNKWLPPVFVLGGENWQSAQLTRTTAPIPIITLSPFHILNSWIAILFITAATSFVPAFIMNQWQLI